MSNGYGAFASMYNRLAENISYPDRAAYFDRIHRLHGGKRGILLDLACGTGILSALWQDMGYDVIGVDASPDMLAEAYAAKGERDILFLCQKMEELNLFGSVGTVFCAQDSLNHITEKETLQQAFERVSLFLEPDCLFLFDVNTPYKHREVLQNNTFVYDCDDCYCVWQNTLLPDDIVEISLDLFSETEDGLYLREQEEFAERAYDDDTLREMLTTAGFVVEATYAADSENSPNDKTERILYVARKKE